MSIGSRDTLAVPGLTYGQPTTTRRAPTSTDVADAEVPLGLEIELDDGRKYKYFNAREAIVIGQICTILNPDDGDISAAASDNTLTTAAADFTANEFDDSTADRREYYAATNANTGTGQVRRIRSNTTTVLTLDLAWTTATDATTDYVTFGPYHAAVSTGVGQMIVAVAISAITSASNGWMQIKGFCPMVRFIGTADPSILGRGIMSSGTAGVAKGPTAGGVTATEAEVRFGYALYPYPSADAAGRGIAAILQCAYA